MHAALSWSLSSKSVFAFAFYCLLGHGSAPWSMELILNINSSWTCGLKSVSMYFSSDGVTQPVHMILGVLVKRINFTSRKWRKKVPKSIENPPKIDVWGSLGGFLEPLDKHLGHMPPKDWILEALGSALGVQDGQFCSKLEAQDPPKSMQEREKVDVKKSYVFGILFLGARSSF